MATGGKARVAFIQAEIDFNVFRELLDGCGGRSDRVVRVNKSMYGLKHAGRSWAVRLGDALVRKIGMEQCKGDACIFRSAVQ